MNDILLKPFHKEELAAKLSSWLSKPAPVSETEAHSDRSNEVTKGLKQLEQDYGKEVVDRIVAMFIPDAEARLRKIDQAIKQREFKELAAAAHSLQGGARNIGALAMGDLCEQVENQGERGTIDDADEVLRELLISWAEVRNQVASYQ